MNQVIETIDTCMLCGDEELLGNGLCRKCWDRKSENGKLFTDTETKILEYMKTGLRNGSIAQRLHVPGTTVERHITMICRKIYIPAWADQRTWLALNAGGLLQAGV